MMLTVVHTNSMLDVGFPIQFLKEMLKGGTLRLQATSLVVLSLKERTISGVSIRPMTAGDGGSGDDLKAECHSRSKQPTEKTLPFQDELQ